MGLGLTLSHEQRGATETMCFKRFPSRLWEEGVRGRSSGLGGWPGPSDGGRRSLFLGGRLLGLCFLATTPWNDTDVQVKIVYLRTEDPTLGAQG